MPQWMNEWEDNISFCSFCSCGLRETSMMVDYTQILKKKDWEKKVFVCFPHYITCGPPQREREEIFLEIKNETVLKFLLCRNFWFFISFVVFGAAVYRPSFMVDYTERRKTERKKFLYVFTITSSGPTTQREEVLCEKEKF
jgi:hypothetical protein